MTEERICPVMSRPDYTKCGGVDGLLEVPCQRERCMAWVPEHDKKVGNDFDYVPGYCRLIEGGR